jgi:ATP-dependent RNA helicase DDX3X
VATSFYTDRDEGIASVLTRTLLETKQEVPEFLQEHIPEGECIKFETESDYDPNDLGGNTDGGAHQEHQMRSDSAVAWASGDTKETTGFDRAIPVTNDSANAGGWAVASSTKGSDPNPVAKNDVGNGAAWGAAPSTNGFSQQTAASSSLSQAPSSKVDDQLGPSTWGAGPVASGW